MDYEVRQSVLSSMSSLPKSIIKLIKEMANNPNKMVRLLGALVKEVNLEDGPEKIKVSRFKSRNFGTVMYQFCLQYDGNGMGKIRYWWNMETTSVAEFIHEQFKWFEGDDECMHCIWKLFKQTDSIEVIEKEIQDWLEQIRKGICPCGERLKYEVEVLATKICEHCAVEEYDDWQEEPAAKK